jgi:hypothetical protein
VEEEEVVEVVEEVVTGGGVVGAVGMFGHSSIGLCMYVLARPKLNSRIPTCTTTKRRRPSCLCSDHVYVRVGTCPSHQAVYSCIERSVNMRCCSGLID